MFYEKQPKLQQEKYKKMLSLVGNLSGLFSESDAPYLPYRAHENIFCKYFEAENLARKDCSADAKKGKVGLGLKTWVGGNDQKVAEFNKLSDKYKNLHGIELVKKISEFRNDRIRITKNTYGIDELIYHVVKRVSKEMQILECPFDYIDIDNIEILDDRCSINNTYFTDGNHVYHFSSSKNTLYMIFDNAQLLDSVEVNIMSDPFEFLYQMQTKEEFEADLLRVSPKLIERKNQLCLRLYSSKKHLKYVPKKSQLNQWNASGRKRDPNEVYISYPVEDRNRKPDFFPDRNTPFNLHLPDGKVISAKVCQDSGKAIMSNPNKDLGEWILRNVFELKEHELLTYDMLESFGIDCVVFTKNSDHDFSIDFGQLGTYEDFYCIKEDEK